MLDTLPRAIFRNDEIAFFCCTSASRRCASHRITMTKDSTDLHVGTRVRLRRRILDMSLEKLAEALGITYQQVQKYEMGTNRIGAGRLQQIARALNVEVSFFFEGIPTPPIRNDAPSTKFVGDFLAASDSRALMRAFMRISDKIVRRRVRNLVEAMADGVAPAERAGRGTRKTKR